MSKLLNMTYHSPIYKIVFVIVILSFVLTGVGSYFISGTGNYVAKVNGTIINQSQLEQAFQKEKQLLQEQSSDQFAKFTNSEQGVRILRQQALEHLISVTLINQYSNKLGLIISNNQIKKDIYDMPIFQTDGNFDNEKYQDILSQHNINSNDFAQKVKQNLINRQLNKMYVVNEFVLPEEINYYAQLLLQQREVRMATLPLISYLSKQIITDKELQDYYDTHQNNFIIPEQVQVSYIKLDAASQSKNVVINDKELKNYYEQNIVNFTKSEKKHYSMIQLATKEKAEYVLKLLASGADFKQLAIEKSTDKFSAINYGSLGWMELTSTPNEIVSANLTKKGQISGIIKLDNNYIIFRLDDIKPATTKPFRVVRTEIFNILKNEKAINKFYSLQQIASSAATSNNESLTFVEKVTGIKAVTTGWFDSNNLPEEIKFDKIANTIFNSNLVDKNGPTGINSDIINVDGNRAFIIRVLKYKPQVIQSLYEVRKNLVEIIRRDKAIKDMEIDGNRLVSMLKKMSGKSTSSKIGIKFGDIKVIKRFGQNNLLAEPIFQMPIPKKDTATYLTTRDVKDNLVIIKLIRVINSKPTEEELKAFSQLYKMILNNVTVESLMSNLRNRAKIRLAYKYNNLKLSST